MTNASIFLGMRETVFVDFVYQSNLHINSVNMDDRVYYILGQIQYDDLFLSLHTSFSEPKNHILVT
jgi:hypothetical protein